MYVSFDLADIQKRSKIGYLEKSSRDSSESRVQVSTKEKCEDVKKKSQRQWMTKKC